MNQLIDLSAFARVVVVSLVLGAGLPALFAVGIRMLVPAGARGAAPALDGSGPARPSPGRAAPARLVLAGTCFAVVLAAVAWGVWYIAAGS